MRGDYTMLHEVRRVCDALTLAGLRKNPFPCVDKKAEQRWAQAPRDMILKYINDKYGTGLAAAAESFPLFTLH